MKRYSSSPSVLSAILVSLFFFAGLGLFMPAGARAGADTAEERKARKVRLTLLALPSEAGSASPQTVTVKNGEVVSIEAKANLGWRFVQWTVESGRVEIDNAGSARTAVHVGGNGRVAAHFERGDTFLLYTSVYPQGAGSVSPSHGSTLNRDDAVRISAKEASRDFIFYKWECSRGCEVMDAFKADSAVRLSEDGQVGVILLTAHFLSVDPSRGSASFEASYAESLGESRIVAENRASVKLKLDHALGDVAIGRNTSFTAMFSSGMATTSHAVSDDPDRKVKGSGGSARFVDRQVGSKKEAALTHLSWQDAALSLNYTIRPGAQFNVADLYPYVYRKGKGSWVPVKSSQTGMGGIPTVVLMEDENWAVVCISPKGLSFSGKGKSHYSKQVQDHLVTWEVEGKGDLRVYKWISPRSEARNKVGGGKVPAAAALASHPTANPTPPAVPDVQPAANPSPQVTSFALGTQTDITTGPAETRAPFFYGGKVYSIARDQKYGDVAYLNIGHMDGTGAYVHDGTRISRLGQLDAGFNESKDWTTCVYKGQVFLFFSVPIASDQFNVYACSTTTPERGWIDLGHVMYSSAKVKGYTRYSGSNPLKAVVFNGRIYLIFPASDGTFTFITSKDGRNWDWGGKIDDAKGWNDKFKPIFSACVVTKNGVPTLCVAIMGTDQYPGYCYLRFIDNQNNLVGGYHRYLDWVSPDYITVVPGSVRDSKIQGPAIQIFGLNSGWQFFNPPPRRMALDVDSNRDDPWANVPQNGWSDMRGPIDSVETSVPVGNDLRKYVLFFQRMNHPPWTEFVEVVSYESDYFRADPNETELDTSLEDRGDASSWWLMGVLEGVPPFTRNGNTDSSVLSEVVYNRTASESAGSDTVFSAELYAETGFYGKFGDLGLEEAVSIKHVFSSATSYEKSITIGSDWIPQSTGLNKNGEYGYLLYAKPTIKSRKYKWLSQDQKFIIGSYAMLWIDSIFVDPIRYSLSAPPEGMTARKPSTDLDYWMNAREPFPEFNAKFIIKKKGETLAVTDQYPSNGILKKDVAKNTKIANKTTVGISSKNKFWLGLIGSGGTTFEFNTSSKEASIESAKVNLSKIPEPKKSGDVEKLVVGWVWYLPQENSNMQDMGDNIPEWVPKTARHQSAAPWCLTWKVQDVQKKP